LTDKSSGDLPKHLYDPLPIDLPKHLYDPLPIDLPKRLYDPLPIDLPKRLFDPLPIDLPKRLFDPLPMFTSAQPVRPMLELEIQAKPRSPVSVYLCSFCGLFHDCHSSWTM
jgi:hypothetical protein